MSDTSYMDFTMDRRKDQSHQAQDTTNFDEPHLAVQVLSVIAFGVFSIVAVSLAFSAFWVAGLIATVLISWTWAGSRMFGGRRAKVQMEIRQKVSDVAPSVLDGRSSGNANFDAYRSEMLESLEHESREFDGFLDRLRDARGQSEFDKYLDDRAATAKQLRDGELIDDGAKD